MIYRIKLITAGLLIFVGITISDVFGQSNIWPQNLSLPDTAAKEDGKPLVNFTNSLNVNEIVKSSNMLTVSRDDSLFLLTQHLGYGISDFNNGVQSQYVDLSGMYLKRRVFGTKAALGLDWTPGLYYYRSKSSTILQSPADIGPVTDLSVFNIPVELRGGLSAYGWNDHFSRNAGFLEMDNYHGEPGYYGGCTIGDSLKRWFNLPIVVNVNVLGKSIGNTALVVMKSSLQTALGFASSDSLYFMAGDSVSNGKELYGAGSNSTLFSTTPWKVEHNLYLTGALRGKERLSLRPAVIYEYQLKNLEYPQQRELLDDVRTRRNTLTFQAAREGEKKIMYNGGISFSWKNTDYLYNEELPEISADVKKQSVNLGDCDEFNAATDHDLLLHLPYGFALNYQLHCTRNSKAYPYYYTEIKDTVTGKIDTVTNSNENDYARFLNHGGLLFERDSLMSFEIYAEIAKNYQYYYRSERSRESFTSDENKIGCNIQFTVRKLTVDEKFSAFADKSDYRFKNVHKGADFDPPPYSRKFSSLLMLVWMINDAWSVTGKWNEVYYDFGKWYGKAYSDPVVKISHDAYAIETKSTDYSLQLLAGYTGDKIQAEAGIQFRDNYMRTYNFDLSKYVASDNEDANYITEPSLKVAYLSKIGMLRMSISRKFNTADKDNLEYDKNWDISFTTDLAF